VLISNHRCATRAIAATVHAQAEQWRFISHVHDEHAGKCVKAEGSLIVRSPSGTRQ